MSTRELRRAGILARVAAATLTLKSAATLMEVTYRQAKRLYGRYRAEGAKGLKHRSAGRASSRRTTGRLRARVLALIRAKYSGDGATRFGPTLAAEHLASEDGIDVDHETLRRWIEQYGVPRALYTDWKNVYVRRPNQEERETGAEPLTQFGRMCAALGIKIIPASSPQAKGRIERNHGTHQDRLVKKLRRKGIADVETANAFLAAAYWPDHNHRFAQAAASTEDFHLAIPGRLSLDQVFRLEQKRTVWNDWVVRYDNRSLENERTVFHSYHRHHQQGDISNELRTRTFLTSLDRTRHGRLTGAGTAGSVPFVRGSANTGPVAASDGELARAIASAPPGAVQVEESELYRRFAPRVRLYGLKHLRDEAAADDLAQQVLLVTIERLRAGEIRNPDEIGSFILGTSRRLADSTRRKARRRESLMTQFYAPEHYVEPFADSADIAAVERCLHSLAERDRRVLVLTFYVEKSSSAIAEELGVTGTVVRVARHRALARLRECVRLRQGDGGQVGLPAGGTR